MSDYRVQVSGQEKFDPREWLRRDVLWASLMSPYGRQLGSWLDSTARLQHSGNVSRQTLYATYDDPDMLSAAFFNQGKNIAGMVSSIALFRACMPRMRVKAQITPIELQAAAVDAALSGRPSNVVSDTRAYSNCEQLVWDAHRAEPGQFGVAHRFLRASRVMTALAAQESADWIEASMQNEDGSLPVIVIKNGGQPRSGGPRIAMLEPIFHQILGSPAYQELAV